MNNLYIEYSLLLMIYQFAEKKNGKLYTNSISALENAFDAMSLEEGVAEEVVWEKIEKLEEQIEI